MDPAAIQLSEGARMGRRGELSPAARRHRRRALKEPPVMSPHQIDGSDSHASLADRFEIVRRRQGLAWAVGLGTLAIVAPFVVGLPSLYRASATVLVEGQAPDALVQSTVNGEIDQRLQAIKQEALSRARLTELIERFNLYPKVRATMPIEVVLDRLQRDIKIEITNADQANSRPTAVA